MHRRTVRPILFIAQIHNRTWLDLLNVPRFSFESRPAAALWLKPVKRRESRNEGLNVIQATRPFALHDAHALLIIVHVTCLAETRNGALNRATRRRGMFKPHREALSNQFHAAGLEHVGRGVVQKTTSSLRCSETRGSGTTVPVGALRLVSHLLPAACGLPGLRSKTSRLGSSSEFSNWQRHLEFGSIPATVCPDSITGPFSKM